MDQANRIITNSNNNLGNCDTKDNMIMTTANNNSSQNAAYNKLSTSLNNNSSLSSAAVVQQPQFVTPSSSSSNSSSNSVSSASYTDDANLKLAIIEFSDLIKLIKLQSPIDHYEWLAFNSKFLI